MLRCAQDDTLEATAFPCHPERSEGSVIFYPTARLPDCPTRRQSQRATHSTSTRAPAGRRATWTVLRAGGWLVK